MNQKGIAPIAILVLVVLFSVGGYILYSQNKNISPTVEQSANIIEGPGCGDEKDIDLCKQFNKQNEVKEYSIKTTKYALLDNNQKGEVVDESIYEYGIGISRLRGFINHFRKEELDKIQIGNDIYEKKGDIWEHYTASDLDSLAEFEAKQSKKELSELPSKSEKEEDSLEAERLKEENSGGTKFGYKKLGEEACGDLKCFRYEVTQEGSGNLPETIWFDDQDYLLRKKLSISAHGAPSDGIYEEIYSYERVKIEKPSPPYKEVNVFE